MLCKVKMSTLYLYRECERHFDFLQVAAMNYEWQHNYEGSFGSTAKKKKDKKPKESVFAVSHRVF